MKIYSKSRQETEDQKIKSTVVLTLTSIRATLKLFVFGSYIENKEWIFAYPELPPAPGGGGKSSSSSSSAAAKHIMKVEHLYVCVCACVCVCVCVSREERVRGRAKERAREELKHARLFVKFGKFKRWSLKYVFVYISLCIYNMYSFNELVQGLNTCDGSTSCWRGFISLDHCLHGSCGDLGT